ncbi:MULTISPECIES: hypothetical protein [unclassified Microcoleus]|uniref:hypothetical protein n=1 Tax=unclassified Microcoleus TaxID=2642155 RepID=UPI002FCE9393
MLDRTDAKLVVNKSSSNADAVIEPVFDENPSLCLLSSRLWEQLRGRQGRLDRVQNLRRISLASGGYSVEAAVAMSSNILSQV